MKTWDDLSIKEKADIMGVAISNGITTLPEIKAKYNEFAEGGELSDEYYTDVEDTDTNEYKSGGKIYIKPSHRGRFTELKKRTGHSATWFKQHGTPAQRKMATFELNSRHWKHGLGGNLFSGEEDHSSQMNSNLSTIPRRTVYKATKTGRVWNTEAEAAKDNYNYDNDIHYRYHIKAGNYKSPLINYNIPFIPEKQITLTNAGLATGAILSTNLLDSIAVNAEKAGLPIKTGMGLATKESTLNNPTSSVLNRAKISVNDRDAIATSKINGYSIPKAHQQKGNRNVSESDLINFTSDDNPYLSTMMYLNPPPRSGRRSRITTQEEFDRKLKESELYDDRRATINQAQPSKSYLQAGFEVYKKNPYAWNPGQPNYPQLVDKRGEEVWNSPEVQKWYREYQKNKKALGGNLFAPGGYVPTDKVKKRITQWEGAAMTGAIDPLSGKFLTNNSFEYEADAFTKALPENIREQVLSNPELADNLYSYSYNVGAGKFKERVVPALLKYFAGEGSPYEIANSMWASGDKKLRGLRNRRGVEKKGVIDSLVSPYPVEPTNSIVVSNPFIDIQQHIPAPIMVPDENQYVSVHTQTQEDIDKQEQQRAIERLNNIERFNKLMNLISVQNNPTPTFVPQNAPYTVNTNAFGGNLYWPGGSLELMPAMPFTVIDTGEIAKKAKNLYQYSKSYLKHKLRGDGEGEVIDLSKKKVSRIKKNTNNVASILTNDFVERNNNTVRQKKDFINTTDTLLGDKQIPLSKISTFYGVEDGKLKAGPLEIFNDTTTVVPNRAKNVGKVKEYHPAKPQTKEYKEAVNNAMKEYNEQHGYEPSFMQRIFNTGFPFISEPHPWGVLSHNVGRQRALEIKRDLAKKYDYLGSGEAGYVVTENNDTIRGYKLNASPKTLFADENGNAIFVAQPRQHVEELNSYLQEHPMYPIMVDNGRYAAYQTSFPNAEIYGGLNRPDNMFIVGTTKAFGGNLFDGFTQPTQQMDKTYDIGFLPEVTVTAPKRWFVGYDDNANPIYTTDYKQSQEYLQNQLPVGNTEQNRRQWAFENVGSNRQVRPGLHGDAADLAKAAQLGIGTALIPLAAGPLVETSMPVMEAMTPGSSFWMNPITQQMVTGTAMSEGVNLANKAVSGYNTIGEGVGDLVQRATGWNPNNTWLGPLVTEALNPGWYVSPNGVMNTIGRVGNVAEQVVKDAATTAKSYLTHPTYQTVYHGSPYAFNVKDFYRGTPYDLGLHVGPKDMAVSAGQQYGSKENALYKLRIPQADTETIDIGRNGVHHLSTDFVWGKHPHIEGWENMGYSFLSSKNKLLPKWLDEAGAELTVKPDDYRGYRLWTENDAHINLREKAFPNISKADRAVADKLLEDAKSYENVWDWEKAPQEMREGMSRINADAADLLSRNGYKVIKYFNNNEAEGAANAFIVTDPSVIDVMPDMSLSKYKDIWNSYQPIFRESLPFTGITRTPVVKATIPQITPENAAHEVYSIPSNYDYRLLKDYYSMPTSKLKQLLEDTPSYDPQKFNRNIDKFYQNNIEVKEDPIDAFYRALGMDKRFKFIPPSKFLNYDVYNMTAEEAEKFFGPSGKQLINMLDIAKAHNFEGKYGELAKRVEEQLPKLFPISKEDSDVALGLERSRRLYSIPEYRQRFNRFGTLGDTFVDDALDRLNNVRLQGIDGHFNGGNGIDAAGSTTIDNLNVRSPLIKVRNTDSSSALQQVVQHEGGHASHGTEVLQPAWMKRHNESIKPKLKPRYQNIDQLDEKTAKMVTYQNLLDEIVTRSKTTIEYADRIRKPGESLDDALDRVYKMTERPYSEVPADTKDLVWYFDKDTLLNFWKNFVGGYAAPVGIGLGTLGTTYGTSDRQ